MPVPKVEAFSPRRAHRITPVRRPVKDNWLPYGLVLDSDILHRLFMHIAKSRCGPLGTPLNYADFVHLITDCPHGDVQDLLQDYFQAHSRAGLNSDGTLASAAISSILSTADVNGLHRFFNTPRILNHEAFKTFLSSIPPAEVVAYLKSTAASSPDFAKPVQWTVIRRAEEILQARGLSETLTNALQRLELKSSVRFFARRRLEENPRFKYERFLKEVFAHASQQPFKDLAIECMEDAADLFKTQAAWAAVRRKNVELAKAEEKRARQEREAKRHAERERQRQAEADSMRATEKRQRAERRREAKKRRKEKAREAERARKAELLSKAENVHETAEEKPCLPSQPNAVKAEAQPNKQDQEIERQRKEAAALRSEGKQIVREMKQTRGQPEADNHCRPMQPVRKGPWVLIERRLATSGTSTVQRNNLVGKINETIQSAAAHTVKSEASQAAEGVEDFTREEPDAGRWFTRASMMSPELGEPFCPSRRESAFTGAEYAKANLSDELQEELVEASSRHTTPNAKPIKPSRISPELGEPIGGASCEQEGLCSKYTQVSRISPELGEPMSDAQDDFDDFDTEFIARIKASILLDDAAAQSDAETTASQISFKTDDGYFDIPMGSVGAPNASVKYEESEDDTLHGAVVISAAAARASCQLGFRELQTPCESADSGSDLPPPSKRSSKRRRCSDNASEYFPSPQESSPAKKSKRLSAGTSCIPVPPLSSARFGLIQEELASNPYHLILAVIFLNKTRGVHAIPVLKKLIENYPTPELLAQATDADILPIITHLGLQNQRAKTLIKVAQTWVANPPMKNRRYRTLHYPMKDAHKNIDRDEILSDSDERIAALEVAHIPGAGAYAWDSWRIFCRDVLRGVAGGWNGEGAGSLFEPEWKRVLPQDKELRAYLRWMWLKEGWVWNPVTGMRDVASEELMAAVERGGFTWDDERRSPEDVGRRTLGLETSCRSSV